MKSFFFHRSQRQLLALCLILLGHSFSLSTAFPPPIENLSFENRKHVFQLNSLMASTLGAADAFWRNSPYLAAALTCGFKASAADYVAQRRQHQDNDKRLEATTSTNTSTSLTSTTTGEKALVIKESTTRFDLKRNAAFLVYGSVYQGMAQEYIYNHLYPLFFGSGVDLFTVLSKVLFDLLIQTTLVTLPIAYLTKALLYNYSVGEALRRYVDDIRNHGLLTKYFVLWGPVQCITFSIIPEHFRVTFIALVSFFWLIILSTIASKTPVKGQAGK